MSEKHRVGIVIGQLSYGGAERQTTLLARGLAELSSYEPIVFCLSDQVSPFGVELSQAGIQWFSPTHAPARGIARLSWLVSSLRRANCSLVYGILNVGNIYGGAAAVVLRLPLVCSVRSSDAGLPRTVRALAGIFCRKADWVIANSESCRQWLRADLKAMHYRMDVVPNGVDLPAPNAGARARLRESLGVRNGEVLVGTASRIRPEKRPEFFTQVFLELRRTSKRSVHFLWVGSDESVQPTISSLTDSVPAADRARLHFVPASTRIPDYLAAFDIFVLTSAFEGMPNALLEAMSVGLPCVATDVEGTRDVLGLPGGGRGDACILASRNEPALFARAVAQLADDPQRMAALGERAREHIREHFSVEQMVQRHGQVFARVLESRKGRY